MKSKLVKSPRRSLRTVLVIWFLLFSVTPLAFVTLYSISKFEKAIDNELSLRLNGNAREIEGILSDYKNTMMQKRERYLKDPNLTYNLAVNDVATLKQVGVQWLKTDFVTSLTFFNREGRMLFSVFKDEKSQIRNFQPVQDAIFLSDKYIASLKKNKSMGLVEFTEGTKFSLIQISKITNSSGKTIGYLEQMLDLDQAYLQRLKSRMKLELMFMKGSGELVIGSHPDFNLYKKDFFKKFVQNSSDAFFDLGIRSNPYGFIMYPIVWDQMQFLVALGASKAEARMALKNINYAFISVVSAVVILLIITSLVISSWILKPLNELIDALHSFETQEQAITIPVKNDTEIGLLTQTFNQMSQKIWTARRDLKNKISELQTANSELKDTQTKLVHSAKMISLGQLVAGVAHELNNPIGFIYSNMAHLRDYADRLMKLVKLAEEDPKNISKYKEDMEFDYIEKDLPKLISSCEDGARRTRDIVLGLRNFSRLEAAKLVEVDLKDSIEKTLQLLSGEIKNRIEVHKNFEPIPNIFCYESQVDQVLMNILSNAVHAIEGQGQIWVSTQTLKDFKNKSSKVQISIQDSGKGMPASILDKIFDPFFTTKDIGKGTGLGLSISYGIVQSHGGEIQVRSEVGVGTEFIVVFPVNPPTKEEVKA